MHARRRLPPVRIHITGASGSGTSTLGRALAAELGSPHVDTDAYYWCPSDPPFLRPRPVQERIALLAPLLRQRGWVLSGSLCGWGDFAIPAFDLVVFLTLPPAIRMERLARREAERYGAAILPGGLMHLQHREFMAWAERYDTADAGQRSRALHETWLASLPTPVLRLDGDFPVQELVNSTIAMLRGTAADST